jgi:hypothetical protein
MKTSLATLVRENSCVFALIGSMARKYPRARMMSARRAKEVLQADGEYFPKDQIQECLRKMADQRLGIFRWSADADDFVFVWAVLPVMALELMRTGQDVPDELAHFAPAGNDDFEIDGSDPLPVHQFQLRSDCTIHFGLPDDLTMGEVKKIQLFLKALATDAQYGNRWPFAHATSKAGDDDFPEDADADDALRQALDESTEDDDFYQPMSSMDDDPEPEVPVKSKKKKKVNWDKF